MAAGVEAQNGSIPSTLLLNTAFNKHAQLWSDTRANISADQGSTWWDFAHSKLTSSKAIGFSKTPPPVCSWGAFVFFNRLESYSAKTFCGWKKDAHTPVAEVIPLEDDNAIFEISYFLTSTNNAQRTWICIINRIWKVLFTLYCRSWIAAEVLFGTKYAIGCSFSHWYFKSHFCWKINLKTLYIEFKEK